MEGAVTLEYSRVFSRVASPCTASHVADGQSQSFSRSHLDTHRSVCLHSSVLEGWTQFFIFTKMIAGFMFLELALVYWVSSLMHTEIMGTGTDVERGCCFETTELRLIT